MSPAASDHDVNGETYVVVVIPCYCCRNPTVCNPNKVPSFRDENGIRQPICENCMTRINMKRREQHLAPFPIDPDAYEAIPEEEL